METPPVPPEPPVPPAPSSGKPEEPPKPSEASAPPPPPASTQATPTSPQEELPPPPETPLLPAPPPKDERTWAMAAHLSTLAGLCIWALYPVAPIFGPLIVWVIKRDAPEFLADQIKESLNAQITVVILLAICFPLMFILIGFALLPIIILIDIIFVIIAAVAASDGKRYRYPLILRLIK